MVLMGESFQQEMRGSQEIRNYGFTEHTLCGFTEARNQGNTEISKIFAEMC